MKIAKTGIDFLVIDEKNLSMDKPEEKVHLIKLNFDEPTREKIAKVLQKFNDTNRFIICDNIKFYNDILKTVNKKYYIENNGSQKLITFFKKNNKVLLNMNILEESELTYVKSELNDVLLNVEVLKMNKELFEELKDTLQNWPGNVII